MGAAGDYALPSTCLEWEHHLPRHLRLLVGLDLDDSRLVTAQSTWLSSEDHAGILYSSRPSQ